MNITDLPKSSILISNVIGIEPNEKDKKELSF